MKIAILGFDRQGKSAYEYWREGNEITICDKKTSLDHLPSDVEVQLGDTYLDNLSRFDMLVRTPGLHPNKILEANQDTPSILDKVTSVTNEFLRVCPTKNIIGVTGTKGKGTTSTLLTEMLACAGKRVHLGGNIGIPPLDLLNGKGLYLTNKDNADINVSEKIKKDDWVVLELANYQLIDMRYSPHIAVCLMIVPEHLDWHTDIDEYLRAKQQIFSHQTERDIAIYKANDNRSTHVASTSLGKHLPYLEQPGAVIKDDYVEINSQRIIKTNEVPLLGTHNLENICAAVTAAWQVIQDATAIKTGIEQVTNLPHRLELITKVHGIDFYNDSIGTTPETAIAAIRAMSQPTILILGGSDKGIGFDQLAKEIARSTIVKEVVLIGKTGPIIEAALEKVDYSKVSYGGETMTEAVRTAYHHAESGDVVLLSPACASFDMFTDYEDRGQQFNQAVRALDSAA